METDEEATNHTVAERIDILESQDLGKAHEAFVERNLESPNITTNQLDLYKGNAYEKLKKLPIIDVKLIREVEDMNEGSFEWVDPNKIIGRPAIDGQTDGWAYEYDQRKGRAIEVSKELVAAREGDEAEFDHVFHVRDKGQRIKLSKVEGPSGPMYFVKDGTHRVAAAKLLGLAQIPCTVERTKYPLQKKIYRFEEMVQCEQAIKQGLVKGTYEEFGEGKSRYALVTITEESFGWARVSNRSDFFALNKIYKMLYPDYEDRSPVPKEATYDYVAYEHFLHGRFDEWEAQRKS